MTDEPKHGAIGSWLIDHGLLAVNVATMIVLVTLYVGNNSNRASQASADVVTINLRLDRLFDKLDQINTAMPVLAEKVRSAEDQITAGRGEYATLDTRLRAIERNEAANHADVEAIKPNPRHLPQ